MYILYLYGCPPLLRVPWHRVPPRVPPQPPTGAVKLLVVEAVKLDLKRGKLIN